VVKPGLQDVGLHLVQDRGNARKAPQIGYSPPHIERVQFDAGSFQQRTHDTWSGHAHYNRAVPLSVETHHQTSEHPLRASGLEAGDQMDNDGHRRRGSGGRNDRWALRRFHRLHQSVLQ